VALGTGGKAIGTPAEILETEHKVLKKQLPLLLEQIIFGGRLREIMR
jgi:hypothetical protein